MRIALVTPEWPGFGSCFGVGVYIRDLAHLLVGSGVETHVLVVSDAGMLHWIGTRPMDGISCNTSRITSICTADSTSTRRSWPTAVRAASAAGWLEGRLAAIAPDVVEYPNWGGLGAFVRDPAPRIVRWSTPVSTIAASGASALLRPWHHHLEQATVEGAACCIANSQAMASTGQRVYGRAADQVIPHAYLGPWVPLPEEQGTGDGGRGTEDWGRGTGDRGQGTGEQDTPDPGRQTDVLYVGRLEHRKGVDVLLAAWPLVHAAVPGAILHLVGKDREGLAPQARQVPGVVVHGQLPDQALADLRLRCGIQVIPSRFESFGLVVLEAWAQGQAVVVHAGGALGEVVADGGIVVPRLEAPLLAAALISELNDAAERRRHLQRGRTLLRERYDPQAWLRTNLDLYRRCAGTPR